MDRRITLISLITVIIIFSALFILRYERITHYPTILENPIEISPKSNSYVVSSSVITRLQNNSKKISDRKSLISVPDLLHHLSNIQAHSISNRVMTGSGYVLLQSLLDGRSVAEHPFQLSWFRGIDGRAHFTQSIEPNAEAHPGQLLAYFASFGVPSTRTLKTGQNSAAIGEFVKSLLEDFHLEGELEWKAIALARYAPTSKSWKNRWGKTYDFDRIAGALLDRNSFSGSCRGTHVLQALAILYRVDKTKPLFSNLMRNSVRNRLISTCDRLQATQRQIGYWGPDWHTPHPNIMDYEADLEIFTRSDLALVTGHHLEWLDILPEEISFPEESHRQAVMWCLAELERSSQDEITKNFCAMSHCYRAVSRNCQKIGQEPKGN